MPITYYSPVSPGCSPFHPAQLRGGCIILRAEDSNKISVSGMWVSGLDLVLQVPFIILATLRVFTQPPWSFVAK